MRQAFPGSRIMAQLAAVVVLSLGPEAHAQSARTYSIPAGSIIDIRAFTSVTLDNNGYYATGVNTSSINKGYTLIFQPTAANPLEIHLLTAATVEIPGNRPAPRPIPGGSTLPGGSTITLGSDTDVDTRTPTPVLDTDHRLEFTIVGASQVTLPSGTKISLVSNADVRTNGAPIIRTAAAAPTPAPATAVQPAGTMTVTIWWQTRTDRELLLDPFDFSMTWEIIDEKPPSTNPPRPGTTTLRAKSAPTPVPMIVTLACPICGARDGGSYLCPAPLYSRPLYSMPTSVSWVRFGF